MADKRTELLNAARAYGGIPYRLDPPPDGVNSIDCSLLVVKAARDAGIPLPAGVRTAEQIRWASFPIAWDDVKPGDLLFFEGTYNAGPPSSDGHIASHIGLSLGAGTQRMIDAHDRAGGAVQETDISGPYWQDKLFEARRLPGLAIQEPEQPPRAGKPDPWARWTPELIAAASQCPLSAVKEHWPRLVEQMAHCGITDWSSHLAMIGTVAIESASTFRPVREAFYLGEPEPAETWRRTNLRYYPYYGRGFIQNTWESNYRGLGPKIAALWGAGPSDPAFDLVANPDNLLDPDMSAAAAAIYFRDHGGGTLAAAAREGNWAEVRRLVLGGADPQGVARIATIATALNSVPAPIPVEPPPLPAQPVTRSEIDAIITQLAAIRDRLPAA